MGGKLRSCIVTEVDNQGAWLVPRGSDPSDRYIASISTLDDLIVRPGQYFRARLKEGEEPWDSGTALEVMIDKNNIPQGEKRGIITDYDPRTEEWIIAAVRKKKKQRYGRGSQVNFHVGFPISNITDDILAAQLQDGNQPKDIVIYEVSETSTGLKAVNVRLLKRKYRGKIRNIGPDGQYAFLTIEDGPEPIKEDVFLRREDVYSPDGPPVFAQNQVYLLNLTDGEKGLKAIDAIIDKEVRLRGLGIVIWADTNEVGIEFSNGETGYGSNPGGLENGNMVSYARSPVSMEVEQVAKETGGETLGCIIKYNPRTKKGSIIPAEGHGERYWGRIAEFGPDDVFPTSMEIYEGRPVMYDPGGDFDNVTASNVLLLDRETHLPGIRTDCEGYIDDMETDRGFGFIESDERLFFHRSNYYRKDADRWGFGDDPPEEGTRVSHGVMQTHKGPAAFNVRLIDN